MSDVRKLRFKTGLTLLLVTVSVFHELAALPGARAPDQPSLVPPI